MIDLRHGDCLEVMRSMDAESVDAVVCDPPYGLSFMGKDWDHGLPGVHFWQEAIRVAKPGAHLLAFGGTRTFHRLACAIEDAGWEIRDTVMWVYGSGFPKSHNVSLAIDKQFGASNRGKRFHRGQVRGAETSDMVEMYNDAQKKVDEYKPNSTLGKQWQGWGTALKPAWEPIIVARKPLVGTIAENVLKYGTGAMNIDGCRVGTEIVTVNTYSGRGPFGESQVGNEYEGRTSQGRWPANLIHDGSDAVVGLFPFSKDGTAVGGKGKASSIYGTKLDRTGGDDIGYGGSGSAARFFYCAKTSKSDRDEGCEGLKIRQTVGGGGTNNTPDDVCGKYGSIKAPSRNHHPTVKPTALMRYLCRLVTPPGGIILDPFMGSGSTGKAAVLEGFSFIGIEKEAEYIEIAKARIAEVQRQEVLAL